MILPLVDIIATFTAPEPVGTNPQSMLWMLPLAASIAVVYKANKVHSFAAASFTKQVASLFITIVVFIAVAGAALFTLSWLLLE